MADPSRRGAAEFGLALGLDVLGAAAALLAAGRGWQTLRAPRPRPLADAVVEVSGRSLDGVLTAVAVVALAAAVALIATRGAVRRTVGGIVALAGAVVVWRGLTGSAAVGAARARDLIGTRAGGAGLPDGAPVTVTVHAAWPVVTVLAGVLVTLAGVLCAVRGGSWAGLSTRYEAPAPAGTPVPSTAALWSALDRGDDPTGDEPTRDEPGGDDPTGGAG